MTFDEATHTYWENGIQIPSVSQILQASGKCGDPAFIPEHARVRGEAVHITCELYDNFRDFGEVAEEYLGYCEAWRKFREIFHPIEIEGMVRGEVDGLPYAGRFDRVGNYGGTCVMIDLKTGASAGWHKLQLAAYAVAHGLVVMAATCVYLQTDGTYKLPKRLMTRDDIQEKFEEFSELVRRYYDRKDIS